MASSRLGFFLGVFVCTAAAVASTKPDAPRQVVSLDGTWQVQQGGMEQVPQEFTHTVAVPGLLDMAQPAFAEVGKKSPLRQAFWYRRTFSVDGQVPAVAILKIHKARYGTKVFLNGQVVGEHLPCFTPAYFDVKAHLRGNGQPNELIIRVGADRDSMPQDMPTGWDFEKYLYIPGIYDSVELILTGQPYIANVQIVPKVEQEKKAARVVVELETGEKPGPISVNARVFEAKTGKPVSSATAWEGQARGSNEPTKADFEVPMADCRLWSPDDPFLYELRLGTGGDAVKVRFGMRSFRFDPKAKRAVLNGRPYMMRGTNVCIYRFFEDALRKDLPWRSDWVRRLHQQFKWMHWNAIRYCIGFPPEIWYDIADEEGFLIQDEFPIWLLGKAPENPKAEKIIAEYTEWMRERWNHPCVVIWDGQNESFTDETGKAIQAVRHLDLSNRPWENGWSEPQSPTDCVESHPYLFIRGWGGKDFFRLEELAKVSGVPALNARQKKFDVPIVINEYCWLWLNRDGTPTCLTDKVYESILGPNATTAQRRMIHARYVAALTEFWRCHREAAGVLHFCGLGYSRPGDKPRPEGGATSDHFVDLEKLTFEPLIAEYVREAFNPVGLMLDFWAEQIPCGTKGSFRVFVINDLDQDWSGAVRLRFVREGKDVSVQAQPCAVPSLGRQIVTFEETVPAEPGQYTLIADLVDPAGATIRSLRDVKVTEARQSGLVAPGAKVEKLAGGFEFTEGPAADAAGNVLFTDQPNDRILKWSVDGTLSTFMQPSGRSNGLCFDAQGNLWACADEKNELWRIDPAKKYAVVVKDYQGKLLNGPNDLWIRPDGGLYFTDPFYKRPYWNRGPIQQDCQGVYYLAPDRQKLVRVAGDLVQPNGVIGTPDGKTLYVADLGAKKTYAYDIQADGSLANKRLFCSMGSDGMTIDERGNVYLTGKGVFVFDRSGKQIEHIAIDEPWTANVCFGGKDRQTLFITACKGLYGLRMQVKGVGSQ